MNLGELAVRPVERAEEARHQGLMQAHHYLGALPKIGETLWYVATYRGEWVALLTVSAAAAGAVISAGGFAVEIKNNCNAIYEFGLYAAAVGAYPTSIGAKAAGILVGGGVLYAVNLARVVSLMALGMFARDWFEGSHLYVWQALFFATVVTCWFGWILRLRPRA